MDNAFIRTMLPQIYRAQGESASKYLPERDDALIAALKDTDLSKLDLDKRLMAFSFLRNIIYYRAQVGGHIREQSYDQPEDRVYTYPFIDEAVFADDIALLRKLRGDVDYSPALKSMINEITEKTLADLLTIKDFTEALINWPTLSVEEKISIGCGALGVFSDFAKKALRIRIASMPIYLIDEADRADMETYSPKFWEGETLDEAHILCRRDAVEEIFAENFFGLILHEKIHNLMAHLALQAHEGKYALSELAGDARRSLMFRKHRILHINLIPSLYFSDPEERICFQATYRTQEILRPVIEGHIARNRCETGESRTDATSESFIPSTP